MVEARGIENLHLSEYTKQNDRRELVKTIKVGVIGVGGIGNRHLLEYAKQEDVKVQAVADTDANAAARAGEKYEVPHVYTDYHDLLADKEIQAVTVAVPPFLHKEIVVAAAEAGKHVHCEKPMALTLEDADAMIAACAARDLILYISFTPRLTPIFRRLQEIVSSGEYGTPLWLWARYLVPATAGIFVPPPWYWRRELGGGTLLENGGHLIDYVRWLMGDVKKVIAEVDTLRFTESWPPYFEDPDVEDVATVILRHKSGAISTLGSGCLVPGNPGCTVEIGTESCHIEIHRNHHLRVERNGQLLFESTFETHGWTVGPATHHFMECVRYGTPPISSGEDGRAALEIALASYESMRQERAIYFPFG
jgi:UDP-N-acetylglucosamine 3-dehydrogenase